MQALDPSGAARRRLGAGAWLCAVAACLVWAGCSIEKHYKTLSFFFDGVPNPEARAKAEAGITPDMRKSPTYSVHKPYANESCGDCHTDQFQLTGQDSSICLKCHADEAEKYPKMHGPVAAAACLWCHLPHESALAKLMKGPARQVCSQCHEPALLSAARVPAHADATQSCLDCHRAHGGDATFFLRDGVSRPAPAPPTTTPPAPAPETPPR